MDSLVKLLLVIAYIVFVFLIKSFIGFIPLLLFLGIAIILSRVPVKSVLRSVKAVLYLAVFTAILNVFFYGGTDATVLEIGGVPLKWWVISVTKQGLINAAFMTLRLVLLVLGTCLLTLTTTPNDLTYGIERLLFPLKLLKVPVHVLALTMSIALRFIPTLMEETDRIVCAQKSRGADFESGGLITRIKAMVPILIPLLASAFRRAEELGDAMDSRCYSGNKNRTRYRKARLNLCDYIAISATLLLLGAIIISNILFTHII